MYLLLIAVGGSILFRLYLLAVNDFPINDGALFLEFVRATANTFPALPMEVAYNGLQLPFSYPPLAFWGGALLTKLGLDSLSVVRVAPILMNAAYLSLFALLLLRSGRSYLFAALAIAFFSVNLRSHEWLLMGGGLSRGLGSIFFLLALLAVTVPGEGREQIPGARRMALGGAAVGLAILSHLEWGLLASGSVVLSRALGSRGIKNFALSCLIAGITALAIVLPWLLFIGATHGLQPLLAAGGTSGWSVSLLFERLVWVARTAVETNPLVLVGGFSLLVRRQWFWVGFILLCEVLTPRHGPTPLGLAMAVLAAQGAAEIYRIAAGFLQPGRAVRAATAAIVAALLVWGGYQAYREAGTSFTVLPVKTREAMAWVSANHAGARFAIINDQSWQNDSTGEWFPTLASAQSVTTVQGREWNGQFAQWDLMSRSLRSAKNCTELRSGLKGFGSFEFLFVQTMRNCFARPSYKPVFQNELVSIFKVPPREPTRGLGSGRAG
jgi:hypothetical protein